VLNVIQYANLASEKGMICVMSVYPLPILYPIFQGAHAIRGVIITLNLTSASRAILCVFRAY